MTDLNISTLIRFGDAPYFVFCDHASNMTPPDLHCLGMPEDMMQTHIAWDIGAGAVAEALARKLNATYFRCEFSRLLIDPNRDLTVPDLIPSQSDRIPVPGNQELSEEEKQQRIGAYHAPYHDQLDSALEDIIERHENPFIISVHSFTHRLMGAQQDRPWRIGLLWREDEASAHAMMDYLRRETGWRIGDNEPYDAREFNYSVDRHIGPRNLSHVTIEVRQDIITDERGVEEVADHIAGGTQFIMSRTTP
ncbi:MAG: N-formylglutamate amidohydrolase [Pseudomonadota bacterium]